jgi:hypothetical protein
MYTWDYFGLWLKVWTKMSYVYHYRLNRYQYIYRYIEQSLDQNLDIAQLFHLNRRLPDILKALHMGDEPQEVQTVIYLSPDEVLEEEAE